MPAKPAAGKAKARAKRRVISATSKRKARAKTRPKAAPADRLWVEPNGSTCPESHPIKAKMSSRIFHVIGGLSYDRTQPDRCYQSPEAAETDGLRRAKR
ncbi:MAG TPA: hypothetical protein VGA13_13075 [Acidimicrobiales bacterium]